MDVILEKDKNLNEETARHWDEVATRSYQFDRNPRQAKAVEALTPEALLEFYEWHFSGGGQGRRKLATWVYGNQFKVGEGGEAVRVEGGGNGEAERAEGEEEEEGEGVGEKGMEEGGGANGSTSSTSNGNINGTRSSSSSSSCARKVVVIEDYHEFKRCMPVLPMRRAAHPVAAAALGSSKL